MFTHKILKEEFDSSFVYPGHPLVLGFLIMRRFQDYASANAPTGHGFSEALGCNDISGAGCHVNAAMNMLKMGSQGKSIEEMIDYANQYWVHGGAGGHAKNVIPGSELASKVQPRFVELAQKWFAIDCEKIA